MTGHEFPSSRAYNMISSSWSSAFPWRTFNSRFQDLQKKINGKQRSSSKNNVPQKFTIAGAQGPRRSHTLFQRRDCRNLLAKNLLAVVQQSTFGCRRILEKIICFFDPVLELVLDKRRPGRRRSRLRCNLWRVAAGAAPEHKCVVKLLCRILLTRAFKDYIESEVAWGMKRGSKIVEAGVAVLGTRWMSDVLGLRALPDQAQYGTSSRASSSLSSDGEEADLGQHRGLPGESRWLLASSLTRRRH
jgi:hypothetical protein